MTEPVIVLLEISKALYCEPSLEPLVATSIDPEPVTVKLVVDEEVQSTVIAEETVPLAQSAQALIGTKAKPIPNAKIGLRIVKQ